MSPTFTNGYTEPGAYVQIQNASIPNVPAGALITAFTGTGKATKTIYSERVLLAGGTTGFLANVPMVSLVTDANGAYVSDQTGQRFYSGVDFILTPGAGTIVWDGGAPQPVASTIIVTYDIAKQTSDRVPKTFTSLSNVIAEYGDADANGDGVPENSLSFAAEIYFANGGGVLMCVQVLTDNLAGHQAALILLENTNAYCIVPLLDITSGSPSTTAMIGYLKTHVENMSSTIEKRERIGLLGGAVTDDDPDEIEDSVTAYVNRIEPIDSKRIVYCVPSGGTRSIATGTVTISGPYLMAGVAGIICNPTTTCGEPISGKTLSGFDTIQDLYTRKQKNIMASYGAFVIEDDGGIFKIRHALATDTSTVVNVELKITRILDVIARTTRATLDAMFINTRFTGPQTLAQINGTVTMLLDGFLASRDITEYTVPRSEQSQIDPRQINVSFGIKPAWDVNYILISFGVVFP